MLANHLPGRFWTAVQKHPELLLSCTFLEHQNLLWQGVTTAFIFSRKLHCLWWSRGSKGGKSLQNKITAGRVSRMWSLHITWKCKLVTGNVLIFFWGKHEAGLCYLSTAGRLCHWTPDFLGLYLSIWPHNLSPSFRITLPSHKGIWCILAHKYDNKGRN